ncbi:MAG: hypothetical protein Q8O99_00805 [bacterium]|nr:hypothetical protein [bacterium]
MTVSPVSTTLFSPHKRDHLEPPQPTSTIAADATTTPNTSCFIEKK